MTANGLRTKQNEEREHLGQERKRAAGQTPALRAVPSLSRRLTAGGARVLLHTWPPACHLRAHPAADNRAPAPGKEGEATSSGLNAPPAMARPRQHGVGQAPDSGCVLLTKALVLAATWLHQPRRPGASPARQEPSSRLAQVSVPFLASEEPVLPTHSSQGERPGMRTCVWYVRALALSSWGLSCPFAQKSIRVCINMHTHIHKIEPPPLRV